MKKRILVLLSVVALMAVMLAMSVAPAFAAATFRCSDPNNPADSMVGQGGQFKQQQKAEGRTACVRLR
jgi:hypothetical protein